MKRQKHRNKRNNFNQVCAAITLVQSEQSLSIKNDQKQDVLPTKDMEKHSSGQNKNERGDL